MSFRYLKKATNNVLKIIVLKIILYPCYQLVRHLKELWIIIHIIILLITILISQNQSGFKRGDSYINQLISITHKILNSLDEYLEVRGAFLNISKAFDKVWHEGQIYKLQQHGISDELLNIVIDFLNNRKQRVAFDGQSSNLADVKAGVPQG